MRPPGSTLLVIASLISTALSPTLAHAYAIKSGGGITTTGWAGNELAFDYDYSACPPQVSTAELNAAFDNAIALWNSAGIRLHLTRGGPVSATFGEVDVTPTPFANPVLLCDTQFTADSGMDGNLMLAMGASYWDQTGRTYQGFILINAESGKTEDIAYATPGTLDIVFAHEMGHVLGLAHSAQPSALMYASLAGKTTAALTADDQAGITFLYPEVNAIRTGGSGSPGVGCGSLAIIGARAGEQHSGRAMAKARAPRQAPDSAGDDPDPPGSAAATETAGLFLVLMGLWAAFRARVQFERLSTARAR